jgi:co-chaperonin GroES (HSP10)
MQENKSGLRPLGVAVLVQEYTPERKGSLIEIPENVKDRVAMVENRARVIDVGPAAWHDEPSPRAKPGDKVLITKFAGFMAKGPLDGKLYRLVNDRDIFCGIEDEGV